MSGRIRFHVNSSNGKLKKRIQSNTEKIFVLVNDALSGEPSVLDFTMTQDINGICSTGTRICRCMSDYFIFLKRYTEIRNALLLSKCLKQRLWENTKFQIKQLAGVGLVTAKALVTGGIDSFEKLANADPRRLEAITGRKFPYGDQLKTSLNDVAPKVEMNLFDNGRDYQCLLTLHRVLQPKASAKKFHWAELVVGNKTENIVLFRERIRMDQFSSPYAVTITCNSASNEQHILVVAALISEEYVGVDVVCKLTVNRETKGGDLGLSEGQGCQEHQTPATRVYGSCLNETIRRTGASDTPVLETPSRYPPRSFDPSPVTLATRNFLNKFISDIKESPLKDIPPYPTGQEPDGTSEIEVRATSATYPSKFSPSKKSDHADSPEILTSSNSSDVVDTSHCSTLIEPSEILEMSGCNPLITAPQRDLLPPRFPSRRLFHTLRSNNEETQVKTSSSLMNDQIWEAPLVISLNSDVSQVISSGTQERRSTNNAGFPENSAERNTISSSSNICAGENLTETLTPHPPLDERHVATHDYVEFNMADQVSGPSVSTPAPSSSTSEAAAPDLLSSDLRRKIRRTGFSSILNFSSVSVSDNVQRNITGPVNLITQTSEKRLLHTDGNGGQQNIIPGPKVLVPSMTLPVSVTSTNALNLPLNNDSDQPDLRRTTAVCPGRRSEEASTEKLDLVVLESVANPCQPKQLWSSIKNKFSAKTKRLIRERSSIDDRLENSSSTQIESPSSQVPPYRELKSFNFEFATEPTSNVSSILTSALEDPEEYISLDREPSNNDNWSVTSKAKRLKADDFGTKAIESNHASFKEGFSSYSFDHTPPVVRPTIARVSGSVTTESSPAGKQEFMGYKSLFSFL